MRDDTVNRWPMRDLRPGGPHNIVGHPLLVLAPALGERIHEATQPLVPRWGARARRALAPVAAGMRERWRLVWDDDQPDLDPRHRLAEPDPGTPWDPHSGDPKPNRNYLVLSGATVDLPPPARHLTVTGPPGARIVDADPHLVDPDEGRHRVYLPGPIDGAPRVIDHPRGCDPHAGPCPIEAALATGGPWLVQGEYHTTNGVGFTRCAWQPERS